MKNPGAGGPEFIARLLLRHNPGTGVTELHLRSALAEAVSHPGGLVRAGLVLGAAEHHGLNLAAAEQLASALEYWHQASLIFDDLPCMDDGTRRRGRLCLHHTHGEATAVLSALALINCAYFLVHRAYVGESAEVRQTACDLVDAALGPTGILDGQARDLQFDRGPRTSREVSRIAWRKTGALLWLALSLPVLSSGAWQRERRALRAIAVYWALAYQAMDDLLDVAGLENGSGKTAGRDAALCRPNLSAALGGPLARRRIELLLDRATGRLRALCSRDPKWSYLADWHESLFLARYRLLVAA